MTSAPSLGSDCRFCAIGQGHAFHGAADLPIDSTRDYLAIASIGAFVEGWSLVLPKEHCLSLRDLYGTEAFSDFLQRAVAIVEASYGPSVIFEHGANHNGSLTSCGTDHGHMHIVPVAFPLRAAITESELAPWERIRFSEIRDTVRDSEYLFFSEAPLMPNPTGYVHKLTYPVSQFFRKVIAKRIGKSHMVDYRRHLLLTAAERTRERLAQIA